MASNEHKTISFAILTQPNGCLHLKLSPQNYQSEFKSFLRENNLPKQEALELKYQIQKALSTRAEEIKSQRARVQRSQRHGQNGEKTKMSTPTQTQYNMLKLFDKQKSTQQQKIFEPVPQKLNSFIEKGKSNHYEQSNVGRFHQEQMSKHKQGQKITHFKLEVPSKHSQITAEHNSPRFNHNQENNLTQHFEKEEEQDTHPRSIPQMSPYRTLEISPNSAQSNSSKKAIDSIFDHGVSKFNPDEPKGSEKNKKFILLQNCSAFKQVKCENTTVQRKQRVIKSPQEVAEVYKRISETQTISFKMKRAKQINTKQQGQYLQCLAYAVNHLPTSLHHLQDMSIKTTQSFRAKNRPEKNNQEAKQLEEYQISFSQHLRKKQQDRKFRENQKKKNEGMSKLNGSRCESKILKELLSKKEDQLQKRQKQIKARISEQKRLNVHRDLSKKSISPASKYNLKSRECPSCSPKQKKDRDIKSRKQATYEINRNKKYVSNVLSQSYAQFSGK